MTDYIKLEKDLNKIKYKGTGIGSLLALEFGFLHKETYKNKGLKNYFIFIKILLRAFINKTPFYPKKTILYYKSGDKNHHLKIFSSFKKNEETILLTGGSKDAIISFHVFQTNIKEFLELFNWSINSFKGFKIILNKNFIDKNEMSLFLDLIINMLRLDFWDNFFIKNKIKITIGDYDRGNSSVPVFLASKKHKVPSVVIQHGAINPPYGYTPLIADTVFVWGAMQQEQYLSLGLVKERIKITGTPIISEIRKKKDFKSNTRKKNIVLAVNPIKEIYIKKQMDDFSRLNNDNKYNLYVKVHPSQTVDKIKKLMGDDSIKILPKKIAFTHFVELCDILVTHSSGLANECIINDIPVIILDNLSISAGNGLELHKFCKVPLVKDADALVQVIEHIGSVSIHKDELYYKTGEEAKKEIVRETLKKYNEIF